MIPGNASTFERRFLHHAAWMLGCNLRVMGGDVLGCDIPKGSLEWSLLGLQDYCAEMRLICQEEKIRRLSL
jgi:hypothetical protein